MPVQKKYGNLLKGPRNEMVLSIAIKLKEFYSIEMFASLVKDEIALFYEHDRYNRCRSKWIWE